MVGPEIWILGTVAVCALLFGGGAWVGYITGAAQLEAERDRHAGTLRALEEALEDRDHGASVARSMLEVEREAVARRGVAPSLARRRLLQSWRVAPGGTFPPPAGATAGPSDGDPPAGGNVDGQRSEGDNHHAV